MVFSVVAITNISINIMLNTLVSCAGQLNVNSFLLKEMEYNQFIRRLCVYVEGRGLLSIIAGSPQNTAYNADIPTSWFPSERQTG